MKVAIVYDSVSPSKVTASVAETLKDFLKQRGLEIDSFFVEDVNIAGLQSYDCLLVGAPTMAFRASSGIMKFLEGLPREAFAGKIAAAFDTQLRWRLSGSAVKGIESKLKNLGFKFAAAPLVTYVERSGKENYCLTSGEQEKVEKWAQGLADSLLKIQTASQ